MSVIPTNFRHWACSLSGCDGGNLNADVWISGIEWGAGSYEDGKYYREELPQEIAGGNYDRYLDAYDWQGSLGYRYGISVAKLYAAIRGTDVTEYRQVVEQLDGAEIFKLNLYPIAFDSTDPVLWHQHGLDKVTGFSEKHLFQTWCFYNRFPEISRLVEMHRPKVVIGTGVSYLREFFACFGGSAGSASKIEVGNLEPASESTKHSRRYYWVKVNNNTTLFVIPFFSGANGLNSNHLLKEMGEKIRLAMGPNS